MRIILDPVMRVNDFGPYPTIVPPGMPIVGLGYPETMNAKQESIFNSLLLTAGSIFAGVFIIKAIQHEKNYGWQLVGWFGLTGSYFGAIKGITNIIYHFSEQSQAQKTP